MKIVQKVIGDVMGPHCPVFLSMGGDRQLSTMELIGIPDCVRRTEVVIKEGLCDATFAYQQIMVDVQREVQDYTSR